MITNLPYKVIFPLLGALLLPLLAGAILTRTGSFLTPQAYLLPLLVGGTFGFLLGYLQDRYRKALINLKELNTVLQEEMREKERSEVRHAALFEKNHSIMLLIDPGSGAVVDANSAACDFYGYTRDEIRKITISEINTLSEAAVKLEIVRAQEEKRKQFLFKHRLASGEIREVEVYSGPIDIDDNQYLLYVINDITELKLLRGIIPICSKCKQIRDDKGYWSQVESYISHHSEADFSHSICPQCAEELYPEVFDQEQDG
ncbi:PAS domain S-box protein [Desulfopila sp. IMCC35008]|uniref:PAS domain S-box protein n=1 Tax=Desulfopila sp. IMCC35008 TaxID=2653858 RepID=UPI0013CFF424|nr:PAS domain S-box protein [Desulfopila sp. IMCC35008]